MDLSTFSKETLINMVQEQQKFINEQQQKINKLSQSMQQSMQQSIPKYIHQSHKIISNDSYQIYNEDTKQMEPIDKDIVFRFGSGQIRYKKKDKFFHGIGPMEQRFAWYRKCTEYSHRLIIEYTSKDHKLPHKEWETHNSDEFCCKCKFNKEGSSIKLVMNHYKCLGHIIE